MVNFPTRIPDWDSHSPALLDLFISSDASICSIMPFCSLENSAHVVVSVSTDFPINSKRDAPFHRLAYGYSRADWDGLRDPLRDVTWEDIFKLGASTATSEFCEWVQVGTDVYIPHPRRRYILSKMLVELTRFWISRSTSVFIFVALSTLICWFGAHQCKITWKLRLNGKTQ